MTSLIWPFITAYIKSLLRSQECVCVCMYTYDQFVKMWSKTESGCLPFISPSPPPLYYTLLQFLFFLYFTFYKASCIVISKNVSLFSRTVQVLKFHLIHWGFFGSYIKSNYRLLKYLWINSFCSQQFFGLGLVKVKMKICVFIWASSLRLVSRLIS